MRRFVVWQNLERYRHMLESEQDALRRVVLEKLPAEEQEVWKALVDDEQEPPPPDRH